MIEKRDDAKLVRRARPLVLVGALLTAASGPALAQSSTAPPPMAPSAVPTGDTTSAPATPNSASPPAGQGAGGGASADPKGGTIPLRNATTPPGITKPGQ